MSKIRKEMMKAMTTNTKILLTIAVAFFIATRVFVIGAYTGAIA